MNGKCVVDRALLLLGSGWFWRSDPRLTTCRLGGEGGGLASSEGALAMTSGGWMGDSSAEQTRGRGFVRKSRCKIQSQPSTKSHTKQLFRVFLPHNFMSWITSAVPNRLTADIESITSSLISAQKQKSHGQTTDRRPSHGRASNFLALCRFTPGSLRSTPRRPLSAKT